VSENEHHSVEVMLQRESLESMMRVYILELKECENDSDQEDDDTDT